MNNQMIINNGDIVADNWSIVAKDADSVPEGENLVLPLALWLQNQNFLETRKDIGVWFDSEDLPTADLAPALKLLPLIAINFPVFTDGRGFSIARLLRDRFAYQGELRAIGYVLRDQLCFMKRCGFNSFVLPENADLAAAAASLNDFTEYYQTSVDQPQPLFRRI
ncbi:MAG TPA: DUF934 domain-containing protein [Pseudomonadales bacterium]|nr:DUF934 domain-containing protein [Pseudomonadales bacterium]